MPRKATLHQELESWRSLTPLAPRELLGVWEAGFATRGSLFTVLLEQTSWWGKVFRTADDVDALVFGRPTSFPGLVNHALIAPWRLPEDRRLVRHPLGAARLRDHRFGGVSSAAMVYRYLPIVDHFRRLDEGRVMGLMEIGGSGKPELFFTLERAT